MIKYFRFIRSFFFVLRIILLYIVLYTLRRLIPEHWYDKLLIKVNLFVAHRMKQYIFRLRGLFIKLGQFMGVMSNLFYPDIAHVLEALQDQVPPVPYETIKERFLQEFNKPPNELFATFDQVPIASASLGQVHVATTYQGQKVAVKVLYPGMEELVRRDFKSIRAILNLTHFFFPFFDSELIYQEFTETVTEEMNYMQEHRNLEEIKANFKNEPEYIFPEVMGELSSQAILTTEFIEGIKINRVKELEEANIDPGEVSKLLIKAYSKMIFTDEKYHSDPHPGNIFVVNDGTLKIAFIDFGSVEIFSKRFKKYVPKMVNAIINRRISVIVDTLEHMGFMTRLANREEIEELLAYRFDKLENLKIDDYRNLKIKDFADFDSIKKLDLRLGEVMRSFQVPRNYMYLWRTITLLMGLAAQLDPKMNIFQVAWPHVKDFVVGKDKTFADYIKSDLKDWASDLYSLPVYALKTFELINQGKFKIQIRDFNKSVKVIYRLGHQFIYTLLLITSGTFSLVLFINKSPYSEVFFYTAGVFGVILLLSFFKHRKIKDH